MDKSTLLTKDGDLPREYVVRGLYQNPSYDHSNGKVRSRVAKLSRKDVPDYPNSARSHQNKKTGKSDADDENRNMSRGEVRPEALVSDTVPL